MVGINVDACIKEHRAELMEGLDDAEEFLLNSGVVLLCGGELA